MQNYIDYTELDWAATDAEGNPLPDGTEVEVVLQAIPSYYDDVEDPTTLTNEGLYLRTPLVVDNEEPVVKDMKVNAEDPTKIDVVVEDNQYVAAIVVADKNGNVISNYALNQEEKGVESVVTIDAPETLFYVDVFDYACNGVEYKINNSGHEETQYVSSITIDQGEEITLGTWVMDTFTATVGPDWLAEGYDEVTWSSSDEDVIYVLSSGLFLTFEVGEAIVTATTVATDEEGNHLTAQIKVTVVDSEENNGKELPENAPEEFKAFVARKLAEKEAGTQDDTIVISDADASDEIVIEEVVGGENDD